MFAPQPNSSNGQEQLASTQPQFSTSLLPENNIVDLNSLASDKKKVKSATLAERRTLNDLQKAKAVTDQQPTPVMAIHPQMHTGAAAAGAMVPAGMGMLMNPMAGGNMMSSNGSMHSQQMMMMTPQMQAQWMQQQQQQYAMNNMMHPQTAAANGNFQTGGAQQQQTNPGAGFQFQQQQ